MVDHLPCELIRMISKILPRASRVSMLLTCKTFFAVIPLPKDSQSVEICLLAIAEKSYSLFRYWLGEGVMSDGRGKAELYYELGKSRMSKEDTKRVLFDVFLLGQDDNAEDCIVDRRLMFLGGAAASKNLKHYKEAVAATQLEVNDQIHLLRGALGSESFEIADYIYMRLMEQFPNFDIHNLFEVIEVGGVKTLQWFLAKQPNPPDQESFMEAVRECMGDWGYRTKRRAREMVDFVYPDDYDGDFFLEHVNPRIVNAIVFKHFSPEGRLTGCPAGSKYTENDMMFLWCNQNSRTIPIIRDIPIHETVKFLVDSAQEEFFFPIHKVFPVLDPKLFGYLFDSSCCHHLIKLLQQFDNAKDILAYGIKRGTVDLDKLSVKNITRMFGDLLEFQYWMEANGCEDAIGKNDSDSSDSDSHDYSDNSSSDSEGEEEDYQSDPEFVEVVFGE